jgi:hypothetical protein
LNFINLSVYPFTIEYEESKKLGATLSASDENTIYVPVENNLPTGTSIIFPVQMDGKAFYLLLT